MDKKDVIASVIKDAEYIGPDIMTIDKNAEVRGYGPNYLLWEFSNCSNALKGEIYNLIDSVISEPKQNKAVKGLLKGFTSKFYWDFRGCITDYLEYKKIRPKDEGISGSGDYLAFDANHEN